MSRPQQRKKGPLPAIRRGHSRDRADIDTPTPRHIEVTRVGLKLPAFTEFDAWEKAGLKIARIADTSAWCLGDWLVYGQEMYADRYQRAILAAGLDYKTLRNYAWVAKRFELDRRRERLSFQHHAEVAALGPQEQDHWLDQAERQKWSRNELRKRLRNQEEEAVKGDQSTFRLPHLSIAAERVARWQEAAEQANCDLAQWIVKTLDNGAERATGQPLQGNQSALTVGSHRQAPSE